MAFIHSVQSGLPDHYYSQEELLAGLRELWQERFHNFDRIEQFHRNVLVSGRHLALPMEEYSEIRKSFGARNDAFLRVATDLATRSVDRLLNDAGLLPEDISLLASTTVTGLAVPTLEARLMNRLPFRANTRRLPLFGLGCLAGVAGINRVTDYLKGHPREAAVFISVELCSLTLQAEDFSVSNLVSTGLFGDGCGVVLMVGDEHPLAASAAYEVLHGESEFFPDSERIMGWDIVDEGFKVVLSSKVPAIARENVPPAVDRLLAGHHMTRKDIGHYICHPGGPKVMEGIEQGLGLEAGELELSWDCLSRLGNMSSSSVLFILQKTIEKLQQEKRSGERGIMLAMGPAFCAEMTMVRSRNFQ